MTGIRSKRGVPTAEDFRSYRGTPFVLDMNTGITIASAFDQAIG